MTGHYVLTADCAKCKQRVTFALPFKAVDEWLVNEQCKMFIPV